MLLLVNVGLIIWTIVGNVADASTLTINPEPPILYFTVGKPVAITCTATVDAASAALSNQVAFLKLGYTKYPNDIVQCFVFGQSTGFRTLPSSSWAGVANFTWTNLQSISVQGIFYLSSIQDGNYSCTASFSAASDVVQSFQVLTTKRPDGIYISTNGVQSNTSTIELYDDANATLTCMVINSKPGYSLMWSASIGTAPFASSVNASNGVVNSSISFVVTGSSTIHGTLLTCTGVSTLNVPDLGTSTTSVTINVIYGPSNTISNFSLSLPGGDVRCPLNSYPAINSYVWTQDGSTISCTTQSCFISSTTRTQTQLTCQGTNPRTTASATASITIEWAAPTTVALLTTTTASSTPTPPASLDVGAIVGIVIGAVIVLVLIIVIPVICVKHMRNKGGSGGSRRPNTSATSAQQPPRPYNFDVSASHGIVASSGGRKSPMSAQPDLVRNSGFSPSALDAGQQQKSPATPPPAYPGAIDMIDQKPRSRKPIALYDNNFDEGYPNQTNASYMPSPKY